MHHKLKCLLGRRLKTGCSWTNQDRNLAWGDHAAANAHPLFWPVLHIRICALCRPPPMITATAKTAASGLDHRLRLRVRGEPQRACGTGRIEPEFLPPPGFITVAMQLAMMSPAERHREFVADLATECTRLRETQMVWIGRPPAADQARLLNHMPDMIAVTNATRFGEDEHTLVYLSCRAGLLGQARLREHLVALCTLCLCHR